MTTEAKTTQWMEVMDYRTAHCLGTVSVRQPYREQYESGQHLHYQWPQGIARAGDVLPSSWIERHGIDPDATIYLEAVAAPAETEAEVGRRIGEAMARDVLAEGMAREWTGLDPQDADQIPDGLDFEEVEEVARKAYLATLAAQDRDHNPKG